MCESLIMKFSQTHPCWTASLLERAGEDYKKIQVLEKKGLILSHDGFYWLSDLGRSAFSKISYELFIYETPGNIPDNPANSVIATELWLELERCNLQRWGIKRYLFRPQIPVRPALRRSKIFEIEDENNVRWLYKNNLTVKKVMENRKSPSEILLEWLELPYDLFVPDVVFLAEYDFENYLDFKRPKNDEMKIANTDRFAFSTAQSTEVQIEVIGKFHRWIIEQRFLRLPGCFDLDVHEQGSANWLIFLTEKQQTALTIQSELQKFGGSLTAPVNPMEIWTMSLEALRECPSQCEVIWDVLPKFAQPVCRT